MERDIFTNFWEDYKRDVMHVFDIMADYFGEERVDVEFLKEHEMMDNLDKFSTPEELSNDHEAQYLCPANFLIYFPETVIKNEYGEEHVIRDLYFKVTLNVLGKLFNITVNRTTYTEAEIKACYVHSHAASIQGDFHAFKTICAGSSPLDNTMISLKVSPEDDLWFMLCSELEDFVQVESLHGGPFIKINQITNYSYSLKQSLNYCISRDFYPMNSHVFNFVLHVLEKGMIRISYNGTSFFIAENPKRLLLRLSNAFIEWWNASGIEEDPFALNILKKGIIKYNYVLYRKKKDESNWKYENVPILKFKGEVKLLHIIDSSDDDRDLSLLNISVFNALTAAIMTAMNFSYDGCNEFDKDIILL